MLALPEDRLGVGVNTAVRTRPEPVRAPSVPPVTTTSPAVPSHAKLVPGSSLKVKVRVALSPALSVGVLLVMARVGASVSMACPPLLAKFASATGLPAASARPAARRFNATVPSTLAVGLTTTV